MRVEQQNHRLIIHDGRSECWIDPWGKDSLRVRMSAEPGMDDHDWALTEPVEATDVVIRSEVIDTTDPWYKGKEWAKYHQTGTEWTLTNGKITAKISTEGWITFLNQRGEVLTAEYWRNRDRINRYCVPLRVPARELKPIPGGTYAVSDALLADLKAGVQGQHASNLGGLIAREIGDELGIPSYIVDPVVIDEMADVARYAGHPLFQRVSIFHALNQKAVAKRFAKEQGKKYEELNLIVCHMGGGVSIGAHMKGSVVDTQNALDGEGPFSPERSGSLPTGQLVKQCFSGKYTEGEMHRMLSGRGGLVAYTGSNDMRYLLAQAEHDKKIAGVVDAFHYQIGKEIGAMAAVMHGKVDQIILTGGIAYGKETVDAISEMVSWIAPITVYPGEDELLALAQGALRVLKGEEPALEYRRPRPDDNN